MYGRNRIDPLDTVNFCNQFLIQYLSKKAQTFQKRGLYKNAQVYKNAIYSIKRYPLPIICKAQLQSLHGIGQYLSEQLEKQIKTHYSAYLDTTLKPKFQDNSQPLKKEYVSQSVTDFSRRFSQQDQSERLSQTQSRQIKSVSIEYKPRVNTVNAYFLQVLYNNTQTSQRAIPEKTLQEQILIKYPTAKNKTWKVLLQTLQSNEYIKSQKIQTENTQKQIKAYKITKKGRNYAQNLNQKAKNNETKTKIINEVKYFKEEIINSSKISLKNTINTLQSFCSNVQQVQGDNNKLTPKVLQLHEKDISLDKLILMIDSRQKNQKTQANFFTEKITKKYQIQSQKASLNLGDFLWVYDDKVLDFIIERKKADDLAASILDGRYKDQKYRLNQCGISNIFYIYEGYPSDNCCLTQKELDRALLKTRAKQKFKVYRTKDINETMKLLNTFHLQIYEKILLRKAKYLNQFEQFNEMNSIQKKFRVGNVFASGLMAIPGVGKNSVSVLTEYFKTYRGMYEYLKKYVSNEQKIQFLKNLFKGRGVMTSLPKILVELLFSKSYSQSDKNQYKGMLNSQQKREQQDWQREQNFEDRLQKIKNKRFSVIHEQNEFNQQQPQWPDI